MQAVTYERFGGPEVLERHGLPEPEPGPGEVRVRVRAASINPVDGKFAKARAILALADVQQATRFAEQGGFPGKVVLFTR